MIELLHIDCMDYMKGVPDKFFDLAIVDPPYGLNIAKEKPRVSGRWNYTPKTWDIETPPQEYFDELIRVSKNRIVWGGNYFSLGKCRGYIVWDKQQPVDNFADSEFAYTSFDRVAKTFRYPIIKQNFHTVKIHPTQKPADLYRWILTHYANEGDKIFDSHLGSGSIAIACHDLKFDLVGCEIDKDYYDAAVKRYNNHKKQLTIF